MDSNHKTGGYDHHSLCIGAGILPFCVDPVWNRVYFILGKEQTHPNWPGGSDTWSDFGGGAQDVDQRNSIHVAAREFMEESLGCIPYFAYDVKRKSPRGDLDDIIASLERGEYFRKIIKQWPCDPVPVLPIDMVQSDNMDSAVSVQSESASSDSVLSVHSDSASVISSASASASSSSSKRRKRKALLKKQEQNLLYQTKCYILYVKQVPWAPEWLYMFQETSRMLKSVRGVSGQTAKIMAQQYLATYLDGDGKLQIKRAFFEKKKIGLWSCAELKMATTCHGTLAVRGKHLEMCRDSFLGMIRILLDEFSLVLPECIT